jgi:hypothetical protein
MAVVVFSILPFQNIHESNTKNSICVSYSQSLIKEFFFHIQELFIIV